MGDESGNADFLMFADVDYAHPEVIKDVINWGEWVFSGIQTQGVQIRCMPAFLRAVHQ